MAIGWLISVMNRNQMLKPKIDSIVNSNNSNKSIITLAK
jgi:hypothetical protein